MQNLLVRIAELLTDYFHWIAVTWSAVLFVILMSDYLDSTNAFVILIPLCGAILIGYFSAALVIALPCCLILVFAAQWDDNSD